MEKLKFEVEVCGDELMQHFDNDECTELYHYVSCAMFIIDMTADAGMGCYKELRKKYPTTKINELFKLNPKISRIKNKFIRFDNQALDYMTKLVFFDQLNKPKT